MSAFWNFVTKMTGGTLAKAEDVNVNLQGINTGLNLVEIELNKTIQITNLPGTVDIGDSVAVRSDLFIGFDSSGDVVAKAIAVLAAAVSIADGGGIITATDVEAALQELKTAIDLNTAKVTNSNHSGDATGATALTLAAAAISGKTALTGVNLSDTDEILINDAGTLKRLDVVELKNYLWGVLATNHIRAGNTQILDGASINTSFIVVDAVMASGVWETIGPTGSGADNILANMDNIPANATIGIFMLEIGLTTDGTSTASLSVYATNGNSSRSPAIYENRVGFVESDIDAAITGENGCMIEVRIPLASDNLDIRMQIVITNAASQTVNLFYKGFQTD